MGFGEIAHAPGKQRGADYGQQPEARAPADRLVERAAERRAEHRRERGRHRRVADPARRARPAAAVADRRHRHRIDRRDRRLHQPAAEKHVDIGRHRATERTEREQRDARQHDRPAPEPVGQRPRHAFERRGHRRIATERQRDERIVGMQVAHDRRQRRQEQAQRQHRQRAQHDQRGVPGRRRVGSGRQVRSQADALPRTGRAAVRNTKKSPRTSRGRMGAGAVPLPDPAPVDDYDEASGFHAEWLCRMAPEYVADRSRYPTMLGGRQPPRQRATACAPTRTSARCCAGSARRSRCRRSLRASARRPASRAACR